jgi:predicted DNA-binding antitoxin AbrB/MazE fold protein
MAHTIEAVYENGVFRPQQALPVSLKEHQRVVLTVATPSTWVQDTAGLIPWSGDHETLRRLAEDVEFDPQEGS